MLSRLQPVCHLWLTCTIAGLLCLTSLNELNAATVSIGATQDNSIFGDNQSNASGSGPIIYTGRANNATGFRRALIQFDIAGSIPAGATIDQVTLTLQMEDAANLGPATSTVTMHRLNSAWGEGASNGGFGSGSGVGTGAAAQTNDATWLRTFYNTTSWGTAGGDFVATASATQTIDKTIGNFYTWQTIGSGGLVSDVQTWLDSPGTNFGWLMKGTETATQTTRRFYSSEGSSIGTVPSLTIQYTASVSAALPEPGSWLLTLLLLSLSRVSLRRSRRQAVAAA